MDEIKIFEDLFDKKIIAILKILFREKSKKYYLQELSELSKIPIATTLRILNKLEKLELITVEKISRTKLYYIIENKKTAILSNIFKVDKRILDIFIEQIKELPNLKSVILHGKEHPDKANVLLIGEDLDPGFIKHICADIKEKYKFSLTTLSLTENQYEQMSHMGLYSGNKKTLLEK